MNDPVLRLLSKPGTLPADVPTLLKKLAWPEARRAEVQSVLHLEEREGRLVRIKGDRYVRPDEAGLVTGRLRVNRSGRGWVLPDDPAVGEVAVPEPATGTAFNEDRVLVRRDPAGDTGVVIRVLERRRTRFVGTLQRGQGVLKVVPDDPRIPHEFYVAEPRGAARRARPGDKVVVELKEWESRRSNPEGEVVECLGRPTDSGVDMLSVLRQYSLEKEFPKAVVDGARAFGSQVRPSDLAGRLDCRSHRVVTIDPDDAKDFDDAICVERERGGGWRLWVHVADVAHYVRPGSALDREARERGNSTYLVDRVIPMLPEELSNELCSLKPGVDRLTQCVEFELAPDGAVRQARFHRAVIHSQRRYTYAEALETLQRPAKDAFDDMMHDAGLLAQRLRRARFAAGALELGSSEIKIRLDDRGHVLRLDRHDNDESHQLIEEFMLLANEAVAKHLIRLGRNALHRVHEEPEPTRLAEFANEVRALGIDCGDLRDRAEMRRLTERIVKHPAGHALRVGLLRSLARARYDVQSHGHFGLAKTHYTHFTSPIRRYSDLVVHRALVGHPVGDSAELNRLARHLSDSERNSSDAERDSRDVKMFHYLDRQIRSGERTVYAAVIVGVQAGGFLVDVPELAVGGLVPVSSLEDDFYVLDAARRCWVGRRRRRVFRVGDRVQVRIRKVDTEARRLDFELDGTAVRSRGAAQPGRLTRPAMPARSEKFQRPSRGVSKASGQRPHPAAPVRRPAGSERPAASKPASGRPAAPARHPVKNQPRTAPGSTRPAAPAPRTAGGAPSAQKAFPSSQRAGQSGRTARIPTGGRPVPAAKPSRAIPAGGGAPAARPSVPVADATPGEWRPGATGSRRSPSGGRPGAGRRTPSGR